MILLIDGRRSFLDGRECLVARSSKSALDLLMKNEGLIKSIWIDRNLIDDIKPVLDFLSLRGKMGMAYPVNVVCVHSPDEAGWQILSTKLGNAGYCISRQSIRETLGSY